MRLIPALLPCVLVAACASAGGTSPDRTNVLATAIPVASTTTDIASTTNIPEASIDAVFAAAACAEATLETFEACVDDVVFAASAWPGKLVAICEYDDGAGDVVQIESEAEADDMCSASGLIPGSHVITTLTLPTP